MIPRSNSCFPSFFLNSLISYSITGYLHCFVLVISSAQFVAVALFTLNRRSPAKSFTLSNAASAASLFALSAFTCRSVNNQKSVTCILSTFSVRLGKAWACSRTWIDAVVPVKVLSWSCTASMAIVSSLRDSLNLVSRPARDCLSAGEQMTALELDTVLAILRMKGLAGKSFTRSVRLIERLMTSPHEAACRSVLWDLLLEANCRTVSQASCTAFWFWVSSAA